MTLLLLFNTPAATSSATGTAFQSFVEAGMFLGNWDIDDYLTFTACTHDDTGAAADADAVPSYAIYEDETAAAIVSGNMAKLGSVTGFYTERVRLTAANGFETGRCYAIRVEAVMGGVAAAAAHSFAVRVAAANVTYWAGAPVAGAPALEATAQAILEDTGTTLPATLATLATAAALATVDANVDAIKVITDQLDVTAVTQVTASSAGHLTITAGLTFAEAVTGLTIPVDWEAAYWTLKRNPVQPDTAALVRLLVTNPAGESDGLQRLNGAEPASPITVADGTLTVTQATGRIDIWLSDELTACLSAGTSLGWDVKFIDSAGDSTGRRGTADVVLTETHATA